MARKTNTIAWLLAGLVALIVGGAFVSMTPDMVAQKVVQPNPQQQEPIKYFDEIPASATIIPGHGTAASKADETCADCHPDAVEAYQKTGMGRSLYRVQAAPIIEDFTKKAATVVHKRVVLHIAHIATLMAVGGKRKHYPKRAIKSVSRRCTLSVQAITRALT